MIGDEVVYEVVSASAVVVSAECDAIRIQKTYPFGLVIPKQSISAV